MAKEYKKGMVANLLGGDGKSPSKALASLFASPPPGAFDDATSLSPILKDSATTKSKKSRKKKAKEEKISSPADDSELATKSSDGFNPPPGIVHESLQQPAQGSGKKRKISESQSDQDEDGEKKKKSESIKEGKRPRRDRVKRKSEQRTVFVGNLPLSTNKKTLTKMFREFGEIESVRFRCVPLADPKMKKKVAVITKQFHEKRHNISGYVCFKEKDAAEKALKLNGHLIDGLHLRVDSAKPNLKNINKRSIFVGNLPFGIEEENVRNHFEDCGEIENIRIIRDSKTNLGKGFCYILFQSADSVSLALKMKDSDLEKRKLRIQRCIEKPKKDKKNKMTSADPVSKPFTAEKKTKKKNMMWQPTNASSAQALQGKKTALKKKQRKIDKKRKNKSKNDAVTRALGPLKQPPGKSVDIKKTKMKKKGLDFVKGKKKGEKTAR